ncbi:hypothetical protein N7532_000907 [Penicillium argentinense]|uniref:NAD(P)-binding domain-containing protein n=1 Tax=Penicillium argentinense TaxID=1131581 RepID=A0A9W9KM02_9EURO|nr:uncharacterized protein N7532_000907 [Penicillium argentinense]KAJ5110372.1 hypothetical protein N7532_000907 [Penicillium argentinense]
MPEHILIFGATGLSGIEFCFSALQQGHQLTLLVRSPHKLPREIASNVNVTVIEGTFEDVKKLEQAAGAGPQIFISFAGPPGMSKGTHITNAMKLIFPMLVANKYKRAMVLGTCSYPAPQDKVNATYTGYGDDGLFLSRKGMVRWVLQEMCEDSPWVGKAPAISNH